jgi:feruloyl esterase
MAIMRPLFLLFFMLPVAALGQGAARCAEMAKIKLPGAQLEITRAEWISAGPLQGGRGAASAITLPAHCRVEGKLDRRTGVNGKIYGIGFALALPENWTGQFLQQGGGGLNGTVAAPLGAQAAGDRPALARGFAVATTDTGHTGTGAFDGSFMQDQQALLDFEYVAIGRVAALAKQIIEAFYQKPVQHSYYVGCSRAGGRR